MSAFQRITPVTQDYILLLQPVVQEVTWLDVAVDDAKPVDVSEGFEQVKSIPSHFFKTHGAQDVLQDH